MLYEERRLRFARGALPDFLRLTRECLRPLLQRQGAETLALLSGQIGLGAEEGCQINAFPSFDAWQRLQLDSGSSRPDWIDEPEWSAIAAALDARAALVQDEEVRLLSACSSRPRAQIDAEDRRAVYGLRYFSIKPESLGEFVQLSEEGVWPRIEAQGARILGLWRDAAATEPLRLTLLTGYHDAAHWQATRVFGQAPAEFTAEARRQARDINLQRGCLTLHSHVYLMQDRLGDTNA